MTPAQSEGTGKRQKRATQVHATTCNGAIFPTVQVQVLQTTKEMEAHEHHLKQIEKSMDRSALIQQQHTRCECAG